MDDCVELPRQIGVEIVADALGLGQVDDADLPLQVALAAKCARLRRKQEKTRDPGLVEETFEAVRMGVPHAFQFGRRIPFERRRDGSTMGGDAD